MLVLRINFYACIVYLGSEKHTYVAIKNVILPSCYSDSYTFITLKEVYEARLSAIVSKVLLHFITAHIKAICSRIETF